MSDFNNNISNSSGLGSAAEPSMEEILASIRRILKEDEAAPAKLDIEDDVLVLDDSMLAKPVDFSSASQVPPEPVAPAHPEVPVTNYHESERLHETSFAASAGNFMQDFSAPEEAAPPPYHQEPPAGYHAEYPSTQPFEEFSPAMPENDHVEPPQGLMSEESSSAAASSIGALIRSISTERSVAVSRGGITIEDIVREEIRPILKAWLDSHLPSLVERLVRSEIARVVDRSST